MTMSRYRSNDNYSEAHGKRYSVRAGAIEVSGPFDPALAPQHPDLEDAQRKTIAMLASCIDARNIYIDDLRKTRDSLQAELDLKEAYINSLKDSLKSYDASFRKARIKAMLGKDKHDYRDTNRDVNSD